MTVPRVASEIKNPSSPIRRFFDENFSDGLYEMKRRHSYYQPPWMIVPPGDTDLRTMEAAAHWLLRFQADPSPDLSPAARGADACVKARIDVRDALAGLPGALAADTDPTLVSHACWALALLTCAARGDMGAAHRAEVRKSPLGIFLDGPATTTGLLGLAPQDALNQLAAFRHIYATRLLPRLGRSGTCVVGPQLSGASVLRVEPCLTDGVLLLDVTAPVKWVQFQATEMYRAIATALLDFDDEFGIREAGVFSARYAELKTWELEHVLSELAGHAVDLPKVRAAFREAAERPR